MLFRIKHDVAAPIYYSSSNNYLTGNCLASCWSECHLFKLVVTLIPTWIQGRSYVIGGVMIVL